MFKFFAEYALMVVILLTGLSHEKGNRMVEKDIKVLDYPCYTKKHHRKSGGFKNIHKKPEFPPLFKALKWLAGKIFDKSKPANTPFKKVSANEFLFSIKRYRAFWLGHSTTLVQFKGINIMFDPNLNEYAGPAAFASRKRLVDLPLKIDNLPRILAVLISHSHYDHLDSNTIIKLNRQFEPVFFVPLKLKALLRSWGIKNVIEMDWWQYADFKGLRISCVPAVHFSNRSFWDRDRMLWAGWYVEDLNTGARIYYSGDTAYGEHFREIREILNPPDLAILPIGAYEPRWFMKIAHINPEEAIQAFIDLGAKKMLGVHWGTFKLSDEPIDEPPELLREHGSGRRIEMEKIYILPVGGSLEE